MKYAGGPIMIPCPACGVAAVCPVSLVGHGAEVTVVVTMDAWRNHVGSCKALAASDGECEGNTHGGIQQ